MAHINLWELITIVASENRDLPRREECEAIQQACAAGKCSFASELSLEVENGMWTVKLFNHEQSEEFVELRVSPGGRVTVTRGRTTNDVYERREVTF